ncbi:transaldolase [Algiphilus sp. W345]|uniref:Transaldolase n=1 Tax=Banduia mediterranea TaxID=3075609 RepID=A0ABU2WKY4_9GAMM|nr:transaldolase [Algiphilus sp. W345]MDT0498284.1 transaldolase [Algiphilus sp. W345]
MSHLKQLSSLGQSVWLDFIRRKLLSSGELARLIADDGLRGLTSNPAIFEKAIGGSNDYDAALETFVDLGIHDPRQIFEALAVTDIQHAADLFLGVYHESQATDGYVSLEVSPQLANDASATINEARRLWAAVNRPNLMIKVPGTASSLAAIRRLIGEGINVNVTLLFSRSAYREVARAYIDGIADLIKQGGDPRRVASVASFFISRIDAQVDAEIEARIAGGDPDAAGLQALTGKLAIANAKLAYLDYLELFSSDRWEAMAAQGAQTQRLLWASTGTKNPSYRDTLYVDELIGEHTVNTMPPATMDAFRDHGAAADTLGDRIEQAREQIKAAAKLAIPLEAITDRLVREGIKQFEDADAKLIAAVQAKVDAIRSGKSTEPLHG